MSKFFTFYQNNSGGEFHYEEKEGITYNVIVEANDINDAVDRAERIGLYFYGVDSGRDCPCCGDRWSHPYRGVGTIEPTIDGEPVSKYKHSEFFEPEQKEIAIHYLDGRIEWH